MSKVKFMGRQISLPRNPLLRMGLGFLFILGGIFSFLPILGIWMLPLGLFILSIDIPPVRRFTRVLRVKLGLWAGKRFPKLGEKMGSRRPRR